MEAIDQPIDIAEMDKILCSPIETIVTVKEN